MKIILYTPYDCLLKINGKTWFLNKNENFVCEDEQEIFVFPTNKNNKYSFKIDLSNHEDSLQYSVVKREDKILIFLIDGLLSENVDIFNFSNSNLDSTIEIDKNKIVFKTDRHQKIISLPQNVKEVRCGNFENIDYAIFENGGKQNIILYNIVTNKNKVFQGDEININDSGFTVINSSNKFYKKITEEYVIDKDGLKAKSKVFSQKDNSAFDMISYKFMNAIKVKDYQTAYEMLNENLQKALSPNAIKEYFGEISYIYLIDKQTCFALSNGENVIYNFLIVDGKISEISDNL